MTTKNGFKGLQCWYCAKRRPGWHWSGCAISAYSIQWVHVVQMDLKSWMKNCGTCGQFKWKFEDIYPRYEFENANLTLHPHLPGANEVNGCWCHQMALCWIHLSPVDSPHEGQWRGALVFSLICAWTNGWATNRDAGDLRCYLIITSL